uniref:hypothetical protein n=1 Tax=Paractinoplanes polyasparticus TaxID=2856853 RepID=UPI001C863A1E|nr:hypothetical protein [Actinoplanes polyasparticus]
MPNTFLDHGVVVAVTAAHRDTVTEIRLKAEDVRKETELLKANYPGRMTGAVAFCGDEWAREAESIVKHLEIMIETVEAADAAMTAVDEENELSVKNLLGGL